MEPWHVWVLIGGLGWACLIALAEGYRRSVIREDDFVANALSLAVRVYARALHRVRVEGREHVPVADARGRIGHSLIVAANHTAGVDPLLIQAVIGFEPRWMMAEDMRVAELEPLWEMARIIFVDRANRDSRSAREALRHLKGGGVLGVFPEGHIERPPEHLLPFRGGVGFLIAKSRAPVLPVVISGTPQVDPAWAALTRRSRSVVRFLPVVRYGPEMGPDEISADLERRFAEATGWPRAPRTPILTPDGAVYVDLQGRYVDAGGVVLTDAEARAFAEGASGGALKEETA